MNLRGPVCCRPHSLGVTRPALAGFPGRFSNHKSPPFAGRPETAAMTALERTIQITDTHGGLLVEAIESALDGCWAHAFKQQRDSYDLYIYTFASGPQTTPLPIGHDAGMLVKIIERLLVPTAYRNEPPGCVRGWTFISKPQCDVNAAFVIMPAWVKIERPGS